MHTAADLADPIMLYHIFPRKCVKYKRKSHIVHGAPDHLTRNDPLLKMILTDPCLIKKKIADSICILHISFKLTQGFDRPGRHNF